MPLFLISMTTFFEKEKGKEPVKNRRKRKVGFEEDEMNKNSGPVLRSGRISRLTKKAKGAKTTL